MSTILRKLPFIKSGYLISWGKMRDFDRYPSNLDKIKSTNLRNHEMHQANLSSGISGIVDSIEKRSNQLSQ